MSTRPVLMAIITGATLYLVASSLPADAAGRFSMTPTEDGMLRLDTQTGAVSMCRKTGTSWKCSPVAGGEAMNSNKWRSGSSHGRETGNGRITDLERQISRLQRQLDAKRNSFSSAPRERLELPSEEEVEKVVGFVERMIRRFGGLVEELKKQRPENNNNGTPL